MAKTNTTQMIDVRQFKGLNTIDDPIALDPGESPYIVNMDITKTAAMQTRFGYELVSTMPAPGPMRGLLTYYRTYDTNPGDYLILFHSNGNSYYITNASSTPVLIGAYGTDGGMVRGTVFNNLAIFGNGLPANTVKKWDRTAMANLGGVPPAANLFGTFGKRLWCNDTQAPTTAYYSEVDDPDTGIGTNIINVNVGDGQSVTSFVNNNDMLQVLKENSIYAMKFSFDDTYAMTVPQLQDTVSTQGGCYAPGSAQPVFGYTYYLSNKAFESYGPSEKRVVADQPLGLSFKIDPTIQNINFAQKDIINSVFNENRYICQVPIATSTVPNYTLIYNENVKRRFGFDNWTVYTGIPALQFANFRDVNKRDQLYFVSHTDEKLYKFNTSFSDNGSGYDRIWRSKTFQFGERTRWKYIDIEGSMAENTTIFIDINTDGIQASGTALNDQKITKANLVLSPTGEGYIGDNYIGDSYVGAAFVTGVAAMYKFKKRIYFNSDTNYGYQSWFQLRNQSEGQGWKLNRYRLIFESESDVPTYAAAA